MNDEIPEDQQLDEEEPQQKKKEPQPENDEELLDKVLSINLNRDLPKQPTRTKTKIIFVPVPIKQRTRPIPRRQRIVRVAKRPITPKSKPSLVPKRNKPKQTKPIKWTNLGAGLPSRKLKLH